MKKIAIVALGVMSLMNTYAFAHASHSEELERSQFKPNSQWRVTTTDSDLLNEVVKKFAIQSRSGDSYDLIVPKEQSQILLQKFPDATLIIDDIAANDQAEWQKMSAHYEIGGYRTYEEVNARLRQLANENSDLVQLINIGRSEQGREILGLKLSDNVKTDEAETELMFTAATHGDELITTESLLRVIEDMVKYYKDNTSRNVKDMIDSNELFFVPIVNPDGFYYKNRMTSTNIDPNRAFPFNRATDSTPNCTNALIDFFNKRDIKGSIDFHAYGELIMYPWAYTEQSPADLARFEEIGSNINRGVNYQVGQISKIIYVAPGSSADFWYWKKKTMSFGIELSTSKIPPTSQIPEVTNDVRTLVGRFINLF